MSIIHTFDNETEEIIRPHHVIDKINNFPETVVVAFSGKFFDVFLTLDSIEKIGELKFANIPIYKINYKGKELAVYTSLIGGAASAALLEEAIALGGKKFVFFGSCGTLSREVTAGHLIVPTAAYRDEGASYHYMEASDYIEIQTAQKTADILTGMQIPNLKAKTWTTDAFYRETRKNMLQRKKEGCLSVEMECASLAAVCKLRNAEFYQFFYTEDNLDNSVWEPRIMGKLTHKDREKYLFIAFEVAHTI